MVITSYATVVNTSTIFPQKKGLIITITSKTLLLTINQLLSPYPTPHLLFQADTRSNAFLCVWQSLQYSPTITWSHSALLCQATTLRGIFC